MVQNDAAWILSPPDVDCGSIMWSALRLREVTLMLHLIENNGPD